MKERDIAITVTASDQHGQAQTDHHLLQVPQTMYYRGLLLDAKQLLEECPAIGILDAGWREKRNALVARLATALDEKEEEHG